MARGYPDFFGTSVFPMYGVNGIQHRLIANIAPGATRTIFDLGGKVVCQGGFLSWIMDDSVGASQILLFLDGINIFGQSLSNMIEYQGAGPLAFPWYIMRYSPHEDTYAIGFYGPYTVGTGWRIDMINASTLGCPLNGNFWYCSIV